MIHSLKYSVTFPSTGRSLSNDLTFSSGMTAITGPNGQGKTFIVEMIRYSLFGSKALRGQVSDYQNLRAELAWDDYQVVRDGTRTALTRNGETLAVGTRAVDAKIVEVLGFPLPVFDVACSINQGDIAALSNMLPSERKRMVDAVAGLDCLDALIKWCMEQTRDETTRAAALEDALVKPVKPVKPDGYLLSRILHEKVLGLESLVHEMHQLQGWLSVQRKVPEAPYPPSFPEDVELLQKMVDERAAVIAEKAAVQASLNRLPPPPKVVLPEDAEAQLDAWDRWQERCRFLLRHEMPKFSDTELLVSAYKYYEELEKNLEDELRNHLKTCPHCDGELPDSHVDQIRQRLVGVHRELVDLRSNISPYLADLDVPAMDPMSIAWHRKVLQIWESAGESWELLRDVPEVPCPTFTRKDLDAARYEGDRTKLALQLKHLDWILRTVLDRTADLRTRQRYDEALLRFRQDLDAYLIWKQEWETRHARFRDLQASTKDLPTLKLTLDAARIYERDLRAYDAALDIYTTKLAQLAEIRATEAQWKAVRAGLDNLRTRIKSYLVPSLSRVASSLLSRMTGGKRSAVAVTDDFDLFVDGQPVRTLSGAEKALANIALRIGLGQILTCRVFPFLAMDEFDEALDADWAESTAEAVRSLTAHIAQIFVVSHKNPEADQYVRL